MEKFEVTSNYLREFFSYDPDTGQFERIKKEQGIPKLGKVGYRRDKARKGYTIITIKQKNFLAHRLAWLYMTGAWPKYEIDHINGDSFDNRFKNLRDIPAALNSQNIQKPRGKKGYLPGTSRNRNGNWKSSIKINGKQTHLGMFVSMKEAHLAYIEAKKKFHPAFNHKENEKKMNDREQFEEWAKSEGLIRESSGVLSINAMCDIAFKAWQAARAIESAILAAKEQA